MRGGGGGGEKRGGGSKIMFLLKMFYYFNHTLLVSAITLKYILKTKLVSIFSPVQIYLTLP